MDAPPTAELPAFRAAVLDWYARNRRPLPFRATSDPYAILVAETMAQQTQIGRVGDAWRRFLERFPTIRDLAGAPLPDVVRAWAGLGYNRRAVLLHRAARRIVDEHGGSVPADLAALERLPGVGPYTGRAIAATAFGLPVGAVDTNVRRLLGRLTGTSPDEPVRGAAGRTGRAARTVGGARAMRPPGRGGRHDRSGDSLDGRALQALADRLVPPDRAADWTHALMDLGSTVCRARPDCPACPVRAWCASAVRRGVERP
ncbi:MAG TPA: hypothetical protein VNJ28_02520, partial [Candidatus Limnocylindrales bacterium]|nr:hypothetical protein [Candidatus Limnocylindrales bacterium]